MAHLYKVMYSSEAEHGFDDNNLQDILLTARQNNSRFDITGCLVFHNGAFIQYLEGEKQLVQNLYGQICLDSRHTNIKTLCKGEILERSFSSWRMVLKAIPLAEIRNYRTVYDLFGELMTPSGIELLCEQARMYFEVFLQLHNDRFSAAY